MKNASSVALRTSSMLLAIGSALAPLPAEAQQMWVSPSEIQAMPMKGEAWDHLKWAADSFVQAPKVSDQNDNADVFALAKALVYAKTGQSRYGDDVIRLCLEAVDTERGGRTLALGRNLCAYVIAADLVQFRDPRFSDWLRRCRTETLEHTTLVKTHERRANNWGTHAGASRLAVALYLDDKDELERAARVFHGWLGDRQSYAGFEFKSDRSWCADPLCPVAVNPKGATIRGFLVDGALPEEMRRGAGFQVPPIYTNYAWEALQGAVVQAELLHRRGYPAYQWQDRAILRAVEFLYRIHWEPIGDDQWLVWIINKRYRTTFPTNPAARPGKNMGWTSWTHPAETPHTK